MKLTIERTHALAALTRVTGVVARNSNVPILNNVLITAADNRVTFRATDLDMEATASCDAIIETPGTLTVDATKLREVVASSAPGSQLSVELDGTDDPRLIVKSGRSRFKLPVLSADMFPGFPENSHDAEITISAPELLDILEAALISVSAEAVRYYLCGVFLIAHEGRLRAVATNGHHMTYRDGVKTKAEFKGVIIPTKAVAEIVKAIKERAGDVSLAVSKTLVSLKVDDYVFRSKTVDGSFPDYQRVIPSPPEKVAVMDSGSVLVALRRAQIAADDRVKSVTLDFSEGALTIRGRGQSEASDEVEIEYVGEPTTISFNSGYVAAILGRINGAAEVRFGGPVDHTTWRGADDDDGLTVMLPIRQGAA